MNQLTTIMVSTELYEHEPITIHGVNLLGKSFQEQKLKRQTPAKDFTAETIQS